MNKNYTLKNLFDISYHKVLLTGANGQLGMEICEALLDLGAEVYAIDKTLSNIEKIETRKLKKFKLDITNKGELEGLFTFLKKKNMNLTALINNAAVSFFSPFKKRTDYELDNTYNVNIKAPIKLIQNFLKLKNQLKEHRKIINIASIYGNVSPNFSIYEKHDRRNSEIYGASKAALIQLTKYFSTMSKKEKILVNAIAPGGIFNIKSPQSKSFIKKYSSLCPLKRLANTREMIGIIIYLLSESSSYTNGQTIMIDGGYSSW